MDIKKDLVEVRPGVFEKMSPKLMERSDNDPEIAGFFHCVGKALGSEDNVVDSKFLRANTPDLK